MQKKKRNEVVLILFAILPVVYMLISWKGLPEPVPVHYSIDMQPDRYQSKLSLLICMILFNAAFYLLFKFMYRIDPKRKIDPESKVYMILRFAVGIVISAIGLLMLVMAENQAMAGIGNKILLCIIGTLFIVLGNYMPLMKPNYFFGIRTPWTLDNEAVWLQTHRVGGRLFFVGGILVIAAAFVPEPWVSFAVVMIVGIGAALFSIVYSWFLFRKAKKTS